MHTETGNIFKPIPAILGWIVPGLGHVVIGERGRGLLVFAGVGFLWVSGIFIGGLDSVDKNKDTLWFYAQAGSGPMALGVDSLNSALIKSGTFGELIDVPNPQRLNPPPAPVSTLTGVGHSNEYGILFTALAGMMNVVALLDAGSRGRPPRRVARTSLPHQAEDQA